MPSRKSLTHKYVTPQPLSFVSTPSSKGSFFCLFFFFSWANHIKNLYSTGFTPLVQCQLIGKRIIKSSLFCRMLTFCAGTSMCGHDKEELSIYCAAHFSILHSRQETSCTIFPSSALLFLVVLPFLPASLSFACSHHPKGGGERGRDGERWWTLGVMGVSVKSKLSPSGPHTHTLYCTHIHICWLHSFPIVPWGSLCVWTEHCCDLHTTAPHWKVTTAPWGSKLSVRNPE